MKIVNSPEDFGLILAGKENLLKQSPSIEEATNRFFYEEESGRPAGGQSSGVGFNINWRFGAPPQNGASIEDVLLACHQRLHAHQTNGFADHRNANAMRHIERALNALMARTASRIEAGTLGDTTPTDLHPIQKYAGFFELPTGPDIDDDGYHIHLAPQRVGEYAKTLVGDDIMLQNLMSSNLLLNHIGFAAKEKILFNINSPRVFRYFGPMDDDDIAVPHLKTISIPVEGEVKMLLSGQPPMDTQFTYTCRAIATYLGWCPADHFKATLLQTPAGEVIEVTVLV